MYLLYKIAEGENKINYVARATAEQRSHRLDSKASPLLLLVTEPADGATRDDKEVNMCLVDHRGNGRCVCAPKLITPRKSPILFTAHGLFRLPLIMKEDSRGH